MDNSNIILYSTSLLLTGGMLYFYNIIRYKNRSKDFVIRNLAKSNVTIEENTNEENANEENTNEENTKIIVYNPHFYNRVLQEGSIGLGESYMDNWLSLIHI